jgi:hypothetical protein
LATEASAGNAASLEHLLFRNGHIGWLAGQEFDSASRAAGVPSTGMELIAADFFTQGVDESLASRNLEFADTFDSQFWHGNLSQMGNTFRIDQPQQDVWD